VPATLVAGMSGWGPGQNPRARGRWRPGLAGPARGGQAAAGRGAGRAIDSGGAGVKIGAATVFHVAPEPGLAFLFGQAAPASLAVSSFMHLEDRPG
jgi:hypothetical protein